MDKTDIRIPTDEELTAYMEKSAVSANGAYEQSPVVLMVDDAAIGTLGNFSASIGKAKSKKTFKRYSHCSVSIEKQNSAEIPFIISRG